MAGHNKWSKIKRKKEVSDAKKSKLFSKYASLISMESRRAGGDISDPGLRAVIEKAKAESMPKENIERAITRGTEKDASSLEVMQYECYGPGGVACIISALSDNRNRTAQEIKHLLSKRGISLGEPGSASWAFAKEGATYTPLTTVSLSEADDEALEELLAELENHDDVQEIFTNRAS